MLLEAVRQLGPAREQRVEQVPLDDGAGHLRGHHRRLGAHDGHLGDVELAQVVRGVRHGLVGVCVHEGRDRPVLAAQHVADRRPLRRRQEAVAGHPGVVEHLAEVAAPAVGQQDDDHGVRASSAVSSAAIRSAATVAIPHDPPTSSASSRASRRVIANESVSETATMRSQMFLSYVVGQKSSPTPSTRYGRPVPPEYTDPSGSAPITCTRPAETSLR